MNDALLMAEIRAWLSGSSSISKSKLLEWVESTDENVLGAAVYVAVEKPERIQPPLTVEECGEIILKGARVALKRNSEDITGDYAYSNYQMAELLSLWVRRCYRRLSACINDVKELLAEYYIAGDEEMRRCIVDGTLEHIFETKTLRYVFEDWKTNPSLARAYHEAIEWADGTPGGFGISHEMASRIAEKLRESGKLNASIKERKDDSKITTIEWLSPDQQAAERLIVVSERNLETLSENDEPLVKSIVDFATDSKNWKEAELQVNTFWVRIPYSLTPG